MSDLLPPPPLSPEVLALTRRSGRVRPRRPGWQLVVLLAGSLAWAALLVAGPARWIWGCALRPDLPFLPPAWIAGAGATWLAGCALLAWLTVLPRRGQV